MLKRRLRDDRLGIAVMPWAIWHLERALEIFQVRSTLSKSSDLVFDFWQAEHDDVDAEATTAFSAQQRFQSRDKMPDLVCPKD